jgi:Animal haem peroxidase/Catalase
MQQKSWSERYAGGSPEAERLLFAALARDLLDVQLANKKRGKSSEVQRAFHAKTILGVTDAMLTVAKDLPKLFSVGYFKPGSEYAASVRFSNANGSKRPDFLRDMRGAAVRLTVPDKETHDLLMTNFPVSHARDASQFVAFAKAMSGAKLLILPRLIFAVGPFESFRMLRNLAKASGRRVDSVALETYWSRGAILWGDAGPMRYLLRPAHDAPRARASSQWDPDYLHREIADRLRKSNVEFDLFLQRFVDENLTPIEDGSIEWTETNSPPVKVARLTIPKQDADAAVGRAMERLVDEIAFNPWHTTDDFRPLGSLNRARKAAYTASSAHRLGYQFREQVPLRNVIVGRLLEAVFRVVEPLRPWHRLYWRFGLINLSVYREQLRRENLIDTELREAPPKPEPVPSSIPEAVKTIRTFEGTYNDLSDPKMGSINSTFGRNMRPVYTPATFDDPNPITVSRELMTRNAFIPARSLNLLAAAWIQFQVHDWVNHPRYDLGEENGSHDIVIPLPGEGTWQSYEGAPSGREMRIASDKISHCAADNYPVFRNIATPWWDGSEVYGDTRKKAESLRDGARLRLDDGYLPKDVDGFNVTGFNENWWLGLSVMHTLFAREHNVLCGELHRAYPNWPPERVYQTARLIISALIAKIHTVEWTPAIFATKTIEVGIPSNWYGAPKDWLTQLGIWLIDAHALKGIPQTLPNHHDVPYSLTEEFVAVYRLHPLIPDDYVFYNFETGQQTEIRAFAEIQGIGTDEEMRRLRLHNVIYSFGIGHPGAITLHNYPRSLQRFKRMNGEIIDLSVVDIIRDRRRGVPRYNDFRQKLHRPPIRHWEELSTDQGTVRKMREIYSSIDKVDTMIGLHAEPAPDGFGLSDTALRLFLLMASRRLQSDRFLTVDFRSEVYSPLGLDWIDKNGMTSIILRHCPQLAGVLPRTASAFTPFRLVVV